MNIIIGTACGAISGGVTYWLSGHVGLAVLVGVIVFILGLLGFISYIFVSLGD